MSTENDAHDAQSMAGAVYFVVGRGTEGGPNSYRLAVAGVTDSHWGELSKVADNSGYSIGTIQVDLGQRGTWGLGKTTGPAMAGEVTYVDALISAAAAHAKDRSLPFPQNTEQLRADLLTHGNGEKGRSSLAFVDASTRQTINDWASSPDGKKWIHVNVDYPQVKDATESAMAIVDAYGHNITDEHRLATVALLAKTANQMPSQLPKLRATMENGGDYDAVLSTANDIKAHFPRYAGLDAVAFAERYQEAKTDPTKSDAIDRAQAKVGRSDFDPSSEATDPDVQEALRAIGRGGHTVSHGSPSTLRVGSHGDSVAELQTQLAALGMTDGRGRAIVADGSFGPSTASAVEQFQTAHGLTADGVVGPRTKQGLIDEVERVRAANVMSLSDPRHPGVSMYQQALDGVQAVDRQFGRQTDQSSCQLAGALAVGACAAGFSRVDHVVMSDDGSRAYAVQGQLNSPFKQYTDVDVARSVAVPLEQSGQDFLRATQQREQQAQTESRTQEQTQAQQAAPQHPVMTR